MLSCNIKKDFLIPNGLNNVKKVMLGLVVSSSLIVTPQSLIAVGLPDFDSETEVKAVSTVTTTSSSPIKIVGTSKVQSDKKPSSSSDDDDLSYSNSLAKEQKKQEARKKSKSARSKDLCETLGRGC